MPASRLPRPARSPRGKLPDLVAGASSSIAWLDRAPAIHGFATPLRFSAYLCRRMARLSKAFASHRRASCRHAIAAHRLGLLSTSVASLRCADPLRRALCRAVLFRCIALFAKLRLSPALSRGASPRPLIAFQSHRSSSQGSAFPSPCYALLRLRPSNHGFAPLRPAKHRPRCPYQPIAVARRGFASPSPRAALLRSAVAALVASWPSYPMPLRRAVATPARSRRSTRSGPCRCCATGRCRGTGRSRATPARAASPTCS